MQFGSKIRQAITMARRPVLSVLFLALSCFVARSRAQCTLHLLAQNTFEVPLELKRACGLPDTSEARAVPEGHKCDLLDMCEANADESAGRRYLASKVVW